MKKQTKKEQRHPVGASARASILGGIDFFQSFSELEYKQDCGEGHGNDVSNRLCHIHAKSAVAYYIRHNVYQGQKKHEFPHNCHDNRRGRVAKRDKSHLAGNLDTK